MFEQTAMTPCWSNGFVTVYVWWCYIWIGCTEVSFPWTYWGKISASHVLYSSIRYCSCCPVLLSSKLLKIGYSSTPTNTRGTSEDVERTHSKQNDQIENRMNTGACGIMETYWKPYCAVDTGFMAVQNWNIDKIGKLNRLLNNAVYSLFPLQTAAWLPKTKLIYSYCPINFLPYAQSTKKQC